MARRTTGSDPAYRLHKQSGQAIVSIPRGDGTYKDYLLGPYKSPDSHVEYHRILGEWRASGQRLPASELPGDLTIAELLLQFKLYAQDYYRDVDGNVTREVEHIQYAIRPLLALYPHTPASGFGPLALEACQQWFIDLGLARTRVNRETHRIRKIFKWAVSKEMLDVKVYQALLTVQTIAPGRRGVKEGKRVRPVDLGVVEKTLPHLNPHVRALIQVMRYTGARTTEVCIMRPCDIDTSVEPWVYRPAKHKTQTLGHERVICIGPRCREVLEPFIERCGWEEFIFSPARMTAERSAALRAGRQTPVQPSQRCRRSQRPKTAPGARYTPNSVGLAVARACGRAAVTRWNPYQLRHTFGTLARAAAGIDGAQTALGHNHPTITLTYAEKNAKLAAEVARLIG